MSQKTRLSPLEQWDRTVAYWTEKSHAGDTEYAKASQWSWEGGQYNDWLLGVITKQTKYFNPGDLVITSANNGSADRYYAHGVSSKGYPINRMYLAYDGPDTKNSPLQLTDITAIFNGQADTHYKNRTLYIPDIPKRLAGRSPHDPLVREYIASLYNETVSKL